MNYSTLNLYLIAGGTSACLCALLWALSRYKSDAQLLKSTLGSILLFSVAFTVSGFGPDLPRWMTVVGSNMVILSAGVVIYGGLLTYRASRDPSHTEFIPSFDWWGWGTLASTAPVFWYWGLFEPDGHARSAVFSFAAAAISGRTAHLLVREAWRQRRNRLLWAIAALFATIAIWMLARATLFTWFEPPPATDKGANPTSWVTVAGFIAMMSVLTAFMTWLEFDDSGLPSTAGPRGSGGTVQMGVVSFFRNKLLVMWTTVAIAVMGVGGEATLFFAQTLQWENERQLQAITAATDLSASHTQQVFNQVDTVLHAVRSFYQRTGSLEETQRFIDSLPLDTTVIDNIFLVSPQAITLLAHDPSQTGVGKSVDDHLRFHETHSADLPYVSAIEAGQSPGKLHFRVTRCIDGSDGNFSSLLLASVNPSALRMVCTTPAETAVIG